MRTPTTEGAAAWVRDVRRDEYDVYVGGASRGAPRRNETHPAYGRFGMWGNEFETANATETERAQDVEAHRGALLANARRVALVRRELRGKRLACWCGGGPCHAEALAD